LNKHRNFLAVMTALSISLGGFNTFGQNPASIISLSTVVIDPGHGGKDAGCISPSGKTMEKTVVLDIARRLSDKIKAGYPNVKVIMTRSDDTFVTLQGRADIANRNNANLFISIHVNSVEGKKNAPNGYSVHILGQYTSKNKDLYAGNMDVVRRENSVIKLEDDYTTRYEGFDPNDPESYIFMNLMQNAYLEQSFKFAQKVDNGMKGGAIGHSRGISQDPFYVLWRTAMPAVLIECGFMSNTTDRAALITENGREKIASDIYDAFRKYKKEYDGSDAVKKEPQSASTASIEPDMQASAVKETTCENNAELRSGNEADSPTYGSQILVSSKSMDENDPFFKGNKVLKLVSGRLYKYIIGFSNDPDSAKAAYSKISDDYKDSFLVKVVNGTAERVK
jgi:N-acetylmuramoyl-L-alanine amidase